MFIDKYKKEDGYYDEVGAFYEDAKSFIQTNILGFCGCGMPETTMEYVRKSMELVSDLSSKVYNKQMTFDKWMKECDDHFGSDGAKYFMWYFLSNKEFTEHGSSVPGWLTEKGIELLSDLNELKQ